MTRPGGTVRTVCAAQSADAPLEPDVPAEVAALLPMVRRVVGARVGGHAAAEDLVQETLTRVLSAAARVEPGMLPQYAVVTARNLVASMWRDDDRLRRNQHRVVDLRPPVTPDEPLLAQEQQLAVGRALGRLPERDRRLLVAHELSGADTRTLAESNGSTAGAVAAQLNRTRARLRVEYLLELEQVEAPTDRCRPVLLALSGGDRRRQREVDASRHLVECDLCARLSRDLVRRAEPRRDLTRIPVRSDADIVSARQAAREVAARVGFSNADLTLIATAVSEITRNIVRFADAGEVVVEALEGPRLGVRVVARDNGPGIADTEAALTDGYSTYHGLGLGLPGARRLMDEFTLDTEPGRGTTVTMTKWRRGR